MWYPTREHNESTICWHVLTLYLPFVLCKGLIIDWFNLKYVAKASEGEYKLCFNQWFILFPLPIYNTMECVLLSQVY